MQARFDICPGRHGERVGQALSKPLGFDERALAPVNVHPGFSSFALRQTEGHGPGVALERNASTPSESGGNPLARARSSNPGGVFGDQRAHDANGWMGKRAVHPHRRQGRAITRFVKPSTIGFLDEPGNLSPTNSRNLTSTTIQIRGRFTSNAQWGCHFDGIQFPSGAGGEEACPPLQNTQQAVALGGYRASESRQ